MNKYNYRKSIGIVLDKWSVSESFTTKPDREKKGCMEYAHSRPPKLTEYIHIWKRILKAIWFMRWGGFCQWFFRNITKQTKMHEDMMDIKDGNKQKAILYLSEIIDP